MDRSDVHAKGQGHRGQNPTQLFPCCNSSLNSHMAMKSCTQLEVALKRYPIVFSCAQAAIWLVQSIRLSVCLSVRLSVTPFYASAFRRRSIMFSGCPSVRPKPEIPSFGLYMGPLVHPTNRNRLTACPSVRPERFTGICRRMHGGISLKFYMLMYLDHLQNWLVYGHGLLIFIILALFWLNETGQIWGFRVFPGEHMEGMAWNFACWCILTTFRTDQFMATVCWFFLFWRYFDLVKRVKFGVSGYSPENTWREWPEILHADVSWPLSELISLWPRSVDFSYFGAILT